MTTLIMIMMMYVYCKYVFIYPHLESSIFSKQIEDGLKIETFDSFFCSFFNINLQFIDIKVIKIS